MPRWTLLWLAIGCSQETHLGDEAEPSVLPPPSAPPTPELVEDVILQMAAPEVDVLWVIDPSCSMGPYQDALTANFPSFVQYFLESSLDWHVGVTSTDMDGVLPDGSMGRLRTLGGPAWLTSETDKPVERFSEVATLGISGSSSERGTSAVHAALTDRLSDDNRGFFRPGAAIHTIVISDESNQIADGEIHFDGFVRWYQTLKAAQELRTFSAITGPLGYDYERASNRIGGAVWPISTTEWDVVLERLGFAAAGLRREYFLSRLAEPESVEVWLELDGVAGQTSEYVTRQLQPVAVNPATGELVGHYEYDATRNSVHLVDPPPETTTLVRIVYLPQDGY